ncbi:hypothetical protein J6590_036540 [Homalodisca vitripennis]|nr:hypothetical protein J6590_036540 [Homalodisca vitripennis]
MHAVADPTDAYTVQIAIVTITAELTTKHSDCLVATLYYLVLLNGNWVSETTFWHTITAAGVTLDRSIEVTVDD